MKEIIKKWVIFWLTSVFTMILVWLAYAEVSSWDTLTANMWNEIIAKIEWSETEITNFPDSIRCYRDDWTTLHYFTHAKIWTTIIRYAQVWYWERHIDFNIDGSWNSEELWPTDCTWKSISTIISEWKTNNYVNK